MQVSWNPNVCHTIERSNCMNVKWKNKKFYEGGHSCCWGRQEFNLNSCPSCQRKKKTNRIISSLKKGCFSSFLKSLLPALSWETPLGLAACAVQEAARPVLSALPGVSLLLPTSLRGVTSYLGQLPSKWPTEVDTARTLSSTWTWL